MIADLGVLAPLLALYQLLPQQLQPVGALRQRVHAQLSRYTLQLAAHVVAVGVQEPVVVHVGEHVAPAQVKVLQVFVFLRSPGVHHGESCVRTSNIGRSTVIPLDV